MVAEELIDISSKSVSEPRAPSTDQSVINDEHNDGADHGNEDAVEIQTAHSGHAECLE